MMIREKGRVNSEQFATALRSISVREGGESCSLLASVCMLATCTCFVSSISLPLTISPCSMPKLSSVLDICSISSHRCATTRIRAVANFSLFTLPFSLLMAAAIRCVFPSGHQVCLSRACRHLHHHAPLPFPSLIQPVQHLLLIVSQHSDMQNLNRDGKGQLPSLSIREGGDYRLRLFLPHWGTKR